MTVNVLTLDQLNIIFMILLFDYDISQIIDKILSNNTGLNLKKGFSEQFVFLDIKRKSRVENIISIVLFSIKYSKNFPIFKNRSKPTLYFVLLMSKLNEVVGVSVVEDAVVFVLVQ